MALIFDPDPIAFRLPWVHIAVYWYGILFVLGYQMAYQWTQKKFLWGQAKLLDQLALYVGIGALLGARVGHLLFYEKWTLYTLENPWMLFQIREGGLASHGAFLGVIIACYFFHKRHLQKVSLADLCRFLSVPALIMGSFIRIGNFINQEIVGKATELPWAVQFLHPAGPFTAVPRHPVQIYEALCYATFALILSRVRFGKRLGFFFLFCFGSRFLLEYLKEEQSFCWQGTLTMGQLLSLPLIILGAYLVWNQREYRERADVKKSPPLP